MKRSIYGIVTPPLLTFGPIFIVISDGGRPFVAYVGAAMLAFGLALVLRTVHSQQKAIEELRTRLGEG